MTPLTSQEKHSVITWKIHESLHRHKEARSNAKQRRADTSSYNRPESFPRASVRDVILLGEMRTGGDYQHRVRRLQTGHLTLSTLFHTIGALHH